MEENLKGLLDERKRLELRLDIIEKRLQENLETAREEYNLNLSSEYPEAIRQRRMMEEVEQEYKKRAEEETKEVQNSIETQNRRIILELRAMRDKILGELNLTEKEYAENNKELEDAEKQLKDAEAKYNHEKVSLYRQGIFTEPDSTEVDAAKEKVEELRNKGIELEDTIKNKQERIDNISQFFGTIMVKDTAVEEIENMILGAEVQQEEEQPTVEPEQQEQTTAGQSEEQKQEEQPIVEAVSQEKPTAKPPKEPEISSRFWEKVKDFTVNYALEELNKGTLSPEDSDDLRKMLEELAPESVLGPTPEPITVPEPQETSTIEQTEATEQSEQTEESKSAEQNKGEHPENQLSDTEISDAEVAYTFFSTDQKRDLIDMKFDDFEKKYQNFFETFTNPAAVYTYMKSMAKQELEKQEHTASTFTDPKLEHKKSSNVTPPPTAGNRKFTWGAPSNEAGTENPRDTSSIEEEKETPDEPLNIVVSRRGIKIGETEISYQNLITGSQISGFKSVWEKCMDTKNGKKPEEVQFLEEKIGEDKVSKLISSGDEFILTAIVTAAHNQEEMLKNMNEYYKMITLSHQDGSITYELNKKSAKMKEKMKAFFSEKDMKLKYYETMIKENAYCARNYAKIEASKITKLQFRIKDAIEKSRQKKLDKAKEKSKKQVTGAEQPKKQKGWTRMLSKEEREKVNARTAEIGRRAEQTQEKDKVTGSAPIIEDEDYDYYDDEPF